MKPIIATSFITVLATISTLFTLTFLGNLLNLDLLSIKISPPRTITVSGRAKQDQVNLTASFNAAVTISGDTKEFVNQEVQLKSDSIIKTVVDFGISESNIKTQYFNIYQEEFTDFEANSPAVKKGPWRGNLSLTFSDIPADQAQDFADLLVNSGATNIDGPNFGIPDIDQFQTELAQLALNNAQEKAAMLAKSQGMSLGPIVNINENSNPDTYPVFGFGKGGGASESFSPGTQEVSKTITVTFQLQPL